MGWCSGHSHIIVRLFRIFLVATPSRPLFSLFLLLTPPRRCRCWCELDTLWNLHPSMIVTVMAVSMSVSVVMCVGRDSGDDLIVVD